MYDTSQFRRGLKVEIDGYPYTMVDCDFVKPGKGQAFTRVRLKNLVSGQVLDRTFKSGETVGEAHLDETKMQFLYADGDDYHFMNLKTYEQEVIPRGQLGDAWQWLLENMEATVLFFRSRAISVEVPTFVEMQITECEPGVRGDTRTNVTKPAVLPTGAKVQVPLFVEQGEWIRVDTRTSAYVERVKK